MKKLYAAIIVLALSLAVGVTAMAQGKMGGKGAKQAGCSSCQPAGPAPEQIRKFKAESIDLRQEMMNKRFDLQRENLKDAPDSAKIAAIKADMDSIRVKLDALKAANKIPPSAACGTEDCPLMDGHCDKCASGNNCGTKGKMDCSTCNKAADCGCANCSKNCGCDRCGKTADCGCNNKGKCAAK